MSDSIKESPGKCPSQSSKTFCVFPWVHFANRSDGSVNLCCSDYGRAHEEGRKLSLGTDSISKIWNSTYHREARKAMLQGEKLEGCARCYFEEEMGIKSLRQTNLESFKGFIEEGRRSGLFKESLEEGFTSVEPANFDLMMSNKCNLQCIMCDTRTSSLMNRRMHETEAPKEFFKKFYQLKPIDEKTFEWIESDVFWKSLEEHIPHLRSMGITGGEPTLIPQVTAIFERLIKERDPSEIDIFISTNAMAYNPAIMELMSCGKWSLATVQVSMDGLEGFQEYVRYPSKWKVVWRNFERICSLPNLNIVVNFVLQAYNIPNLIPFLKWMARQDDLVSPEQVTVRLVKEPNYLQACVLPDEIKSFYADVFRTESKSEALAPWKSFLLTAADYLESREDEAWLSARRSEFVKYTRFIDKTRKTDIHSLVPGLESMFSKAELVEASRTTKGISL